MATESATGTRGLSVQERRHRNREEMRAGILAVAREIMREQGVAALNLNEIARRVGITAPALYTYFPGKLALYDELYRIGFRLFLEADMDLLRTTAPDWERIQSWFNVRLALAEEHADLYHLVFDVPIPGFAPSPVSLAEVRRYYEATVQGIAEVIEERAIQPSISAAQATDLLISMRLGIVAAHLGRRRPQAMFAQLVPDALAVLRAAWEPQPRESHHNAADEKGGGPIRPGQTE